MMHKIGGDRKTKEIWDRIIGSSVIGKPVKALGGFALNTLTSRKYLRPQGCERCKTRDGQKEQSRACRGAFPNTSGSGIFPPGAARRFWGSRSHSRWPLSAAFVSPGSSGLHRAPFH